MTTRPVITPDTSIRDAAAIMTTGHFRHLPVVGDTGLQAVVDINDYARYCSPISKATPAGHAPSSTSTGR